MTTGTKLSGKTDKGDLKGSVNLYPVSHRRFCVEGGKVKKQ